MYSSTASMQFERPERVVQNEQVVDTAVRSDIDLNTYLQILTSARLRTMVAQSLTPDEIKILQRPYLAELQPGANPPPIGGILGNLTRESIRLSYLITITVTHRDPEAAAVAGRARAPRAGCPGCAALHGHARRRRRLRRWGAGRRRGAATRGP